MNLFQENSKTKNASSKFEIRRPKICRAPDISFQYGCLYLVILSCLTSVTFAASTVVFARLLVALDSIRAAT